MNVFVESNMKKNKKKLNKKESEHANGACRIEFSRLSQHIITTYITIICFSF